ncbi:hypothetical protein BGZ96_002300 [Linnemannia gamsii]|uniref:F-box domain-containing protein n=1 Tax=Linnemannia gamsii TaxID=64522 RepID=A0ABQ7KAS0_9FUNG|nr:hypothetical protein BGZ96_002300 [Linnemannia gamsii]
MRFSLSKAHSRTQSLEVFPFPTTTTSTAATTITASRRISPVEIPELLEIIFSYIDNYTLRMCVVGVCRQWFLMNRQRVVREVIWDNGADPKRQEVIMSRLLGAGRLWWYSRRHSTMVRAGADRWEALVKALKKNYERDMAIRQQHILERQRQPENIQMLMKMRPLLYSSLQDLELIDHTHICTKLYEILPYLATLTRLRLQVADHGTIKLDKVFQACPFLESFEADAKNYVEFPTPWITNDRPQDQQHQQQKRDTPHPSPPLSPQQQQKQQLFRQPMHLKSLVLRNGHFAQSDLESLLALTPRLQKLNLISLRSGVWIEEDETDLAHISASTMACLESHGITLRSFHFSLAYTSKAWSQCAMFLVCPKSTEWTFSTQDLLPIMVQRLQDTINVVTRLEIHHQDRAKLMPDSGLHRYLCESPHLLHLKAPYAAYLLEHMDVHSRANLSLSVRGPGTGAGTGVGGGTTGLKPSGKVWACRNLQSLHLGIHVQRDFPHETKVHSRIVYGYLSIICPKIRDLRIDPYYQAVLLPRPILFMDLDAGLCLLSRLRYLETLLIGSAGMTTTSGSRDLTWMVATGWTAEARKERKKTLSGWEKMLLEETRQWSAATLRTLEGPYVDADLIESLQNLGLLEDVKNTLDKMGEDVDKGRYCWPLLQRLSINRPIELGRAPEAELGRLFPTSRTSFSDRIPRPNW